MMLPQRLGRLANLALAGKKHQHVAGLLAPQLIDAHDPSIGSHSSSMQSGSVRFIRFQCLRPISGR